MNQLAPGAILAQISPSGTTAVTAISGLGVNFEVHFVTIQVDQNTNCTIYHDDDGTTYGLTTQIWYQARTVALNSDSMYSDSFPRIYVARGGAIGVQTSVADAATFTFYGVTGPAR